MTEREKHILFEDLFKTNFHQLYVHALGYVTDEENAKDIVHDAYCYLWEHLDRFEKTANFPALLYSFIRSRCIDWLRRKEVEANYLNQQQEQSEEALFDYTGYDDRMVRIMQAIRNFPPQTRRIFTACVLHHYTYKEVGEMFHISPLTVKTIMARAFKALRKQKEIFSPILVLLFFS